jgi:uncharacterized protein YacL
VIDCLIKDIRLGEIIFDLNNKYKVFVDINLLPTTIQFDSVVDLMIIGDINAGKTNFRYVSHREPPHIVAIPSPIKKQFEETWNEILLHFESKQPLDAAIIKIEKEGFIADIGCDIEAFCNDKYTMYRNVGDIVKVIVDDIFDRSKFKVKIILPDINELGTLFINEKILKIKDKIKRMDTEVFIVDTNVIMDYPDLLKILCELKKQILIVYNVLEELDGLKKSEDELKKIKAKTGLVLINELFENISFESPYVNHLPEGNDKKKNDDKIISVALEYKQKHPVIISADLGLIVKCKTQKINVWNCTKDFLETISQTPNGKSPPPEGG